MLYYIDHTNVLYTLFVQVPHTVGTTDRPVLRKKHGVQLSALLPRKLFKCQSFTTFIFRFRWEPKLYIYFTYLYILDLYIMYSRNTV